MDYEYYYDNAKSRYYNACSEINSCDNRISELNRQKWYRAVQINQLNKEIRNIQEAINGTAKMIRKEAVLNQSFLKITRKTDQAANNYMRMVSSGNVSNKNLNDVFSNETNNTKRILNGIFETLKRKRSTLDHRVTELENERRRVNNEYQSFCSEIKSTQANRQEWVSVKRSAAYDMEYYKKKMEEAALEL